MGTYVELSQVKTWYDERGEGEPLVLLHGGVVDARFFDQNIEPLAARFRASATRSWSTSSLPTRWPRSRRCAAFTADPERGDRRYRVSAKRISR